jgi:hypothetical protein
MNLPPCSYRLNVLPNGNFGCSSTKLMVGKAGVAEAACARCPYAEVVEPGLATKLANFAAATTKHVLSGFGKVTDDQYAERLEKCAGCEACNKTDESWKCRECGCPIKEGSIMPGKARWAGEVCPKGHWPKIELPVVKSGCGCSSS